MVDDRRENDISKTKVEVKGISKSKVVAVVMIIFAFIGLAIFLQYGIFGKKEEISKKEEEKKEENVKENVTDKEKEKEFESELRKSYSERQKKSYGDSSGTVIITTEEGEVVQQNNQVDYEQQRLEEVKAKISAYRDKVFQEELASRSSGIGSGSGIKQTEEKNRMEMNPDFNSDSLNLEGLVASQGMNHNERMARKKANLKADNVYNSSGILNPLSEYEVKAGGIIPITLYTGINTDIPSNVIAVVRENVYDSVTGNYLLIPKGTKAIGTYDSVLEFGQERVLLLWTRLVFPNGKSISLDKFDGVDLSGYGGSGGKVDSHFGTMLKAVVLSTILSVGDYYVAPSSKDRSSKKTSSPDVIAKEEVVNTFSEIGKDYVDKMLNVQPTIIVKQGTRLNIIINSDLILEPYQE